MMPRLNRFALVLCAALGSLCLANPTLSQVVTPPKGTGLVIDNALQLRPAKVMMNMDHDAFSGDLPTGLYYMELILANYNGSNVPLQMVALFHDKGAYMVLNDAAYNRFKHTEHRQSVEGEDCRVAESRHSVRALCIYRL